MMTKGTYPITCSLPAHRHKMRNSKSTSKHTNLANFRRASESPVADALESSVNL